MIPAARACRSDGPPVCSRPAAGAGRATPTPSVCDHDLDRPVEQRIVIRVEVLVAVSQLLRRRLRRLEQHSSSSCPAGCALLDDERDLLFGDVGPWTRCRREGAERLEEHVSLAEEAPRQPGRGPHASRSGSTRRTDPGRHVRLDHPRDHVYGRALRGEHEIDADGARLLRERITASSTCSARPSSGRRARRSPPAGTGASAPRAPERPVRLGSLRARTIDSARTAAPSSRHVGQDGRRLLRAHTTDVSKCEIHSS